MKYTIPYRFLEIIAASLLEVWGWYFGGQGTLRRLGIENDLFEALRKKVDISSEEMHDLDVSQDEFRTVIDCIALTLQELWEEDFHTHTGIDWEDGKRLFSEFQRLPERGS